MEHIEPLLELTIRSFCMKDVSDQDLTLVANTIRGLAMDGVQAANSGHPGMPMGMADIAATLFLGYLDHCPTSPTWMNRDRFVLSAGHGSMLLYSLLHLSGYDLPLSELEQFRQWKSKTPGHPEYGHTVGVEVTTGPLGQGCGNSVGMALAEQMLAARFNTEDFPLMDHYTYAICGDGDLMEGVSHEAFSLAGHLGLNKLILFYDSNSITIEGSTDLAYSDDVKKRFQGYNWNVLEIDAHNLEEIEKAIKKARRQKDKPTIVISTSHIAQGSPNMSDSHQAHGSPLGDDEIKATKRNLGMPEDEKFHVPERTKELFASRLKKMERKAKKWERMAKKYAEVHPEKADLWKAFLANEVPADIESVMPNFPVDTAVATRNASGKVIQELAKAMPQFVGGSADLSPSNKTNMDSEDSIGPGAFTGRNLHFGIREHGMGAILNGMALHGGLRVFGATFFVFADYLRPAIRMAAIMKLPVIYVFTHDSFYVGEDGPTHEPVEQLASLRCMPNVSLLRPADPTETSAAWIAALKKTDGPTALMLTRQNLAVLDRNVYPPASNVEKGAYVLWQSSDQEPDLTLIGSGSEVELALAAGKEVASRVNVRVVSMPSWDLFEAQDDSYKASVIPSTGQKLALEAGASLGWHKYVGENGRVLALDRFGSSAPYKVLADKFGFTVDNVVKIIDEMLGA
jgi:transketolase